MHFLNYFILVLNVIFPIFCKSLVNTALIYNLTSFSNYVNRHFCNMELIQVSHSHEILFVFLVSFICSGVYFIRNVSIIHTLSSLFLAPYYKRWETGNIISFWRSRNDIWSRWFWLSTILPLTLTNIESDIFGDWISWGYFPIQSRS